MDKVRVNIHISGEAHKCLLEMAGGQRKIGHWIDMVIKERCREEKVAESLTALTGVHYHAEEIREALREYDATFGSVSRETS